MIGSLRGKLIAYDKDPDRLLLEVAGVGYWINVTPKDMVASLPFIASTKDSLSPQASVGDSDSPSAAIAEPRAEPELFFYTEQIVREDSITLYGFASKQESQGFAILIGISGIGPQMALAILATYSPADLQTVLLDEDIDSLCLVPGIGPKRARQLLAVLKDRFAISDLSIPEATQPTSIRAEVRAALAELGYSAEEIRAALAEIPDQVADEDSADALLKAALSVLG